MPSAGSNALRAVRPMLCQNPPHPGPLPRGGGEGSAFARLRRDKEAAAVAVDWGVGTFVALRWLPALGSARFAGNDARTGPERRAKIFVAQIFKSAVSPDCIRQCAKILSPPGFVNGLQITNPRHSRVQLCATWRRIFPRTRGLDQKDRFGALSLNGSRETGLDGGGAGGGNVVSLVEPGTANAVGGVTFREEW